MVREIFALIFLLTVGNLAQCQDQENVLFIKIEEVLQKQEATLSQLKGMQEKQEHIEGKLQEIQEKQEHVECKLPEMQEKLQHVEINLQDISAKLETSEGIHSEPKTCLGREDLEHFKNISSSGQQELKSSLRQEISGVISLLETGGIDECSEGSHNCGDHAFCTDKLFQFSCTCLSGFARDGSRCEDIDECVQGKDKCSHHATCKNSIGGYSCSCNPPFEGDGLNCSCPFGFVQKGSKCEQSPCKYPAEFVEGVGCVKPVEELKTFEEMNATCHEAGGRLLQDFDHKTLQEVVQAFLLFEVWVGVHEGRWMESGLPLQEELWIEDSRGSADPSGRRGLCGIIYREESSNSYKVGQRDCSEKDWGYCQFVITQK